MPNIEVSKINDINDSSKVYVLKDSSAVASIEKEGNVFTTTLRDGTETTFNQFDIYEDNAPYLSRKTGGSLDLSEANEWIKKEQLVGGTVAWNQLIQNGNFANTSYWYAYNSNNITFSAASYVLTVTSLVTGTGDHVSIMQNIGNFATGNKYLFMAEIKASVTGEFQINKVGETTSIKKTIGTANTWTKFQGIISFVSTDNRFEIRPNITLQPNDTYSIRNVCVFDLTKVFGTAIANRAATLESATAGSGIAWLKSYGFFTKSYYPYNAGTLLSVKTSAYKTVGFNQWDEEWEVGKYDSNGDKIGDTSSFRNKNLISVIPNTMYYSKTPANTGIHFRDADGAFISGVSGRDTTWTTPANCYYINFYVNTTSYTAGTVCINLSKTTGTPKNGDYVPHDGRTYPLDSDLELRGIPKLDANNRLYYDGDIYKSDGTVTRRYGIVDLGSIDNWMYGGGDGTVWYTNVFRAKAVANNNQIGNGLPSSKLTMRAYSSFSHSSSINYSIAIDNVGALRVRINSVGSSRSNLLEYLSGVYFIYERATPTTENTEPYASLQPVDSTGTEEFVDTRTVQIPVGHNTKYRSNDYIWNTLDTKVTQTEKSDNTEYKLLFSDSVSPISGNAAGVGFDSGITVNPNTNTISATTFNGNATSTTILATSRTLWGQSFNGSANISGDMSSVGNISPASTNAKTLGTSSLRWSKAYIGTADSYGSTTQPIYWNAGVPTAITGAIANDTTGTAARATADASGNTITTTYAPLASPALTGTPTAPTAANNTNSTQVATTEFVQNLAVKVVRLI